MKMRLVDLIQRKARPAPWAEGETIPWDDPGFSERMLKEHRSQEHDAASRRREKVQQQVQWIHQTLLSGRATRILDLGCGPGLYTSRLARLGHECVGIDCSPASVAYAEREAGEERLRCTYLQQDLREAEYGAGFGLVMLIYGQFNVFRQGDAKGILAKAWTALEDGGLLLLEPHQFAGVQRMGEKGRSWYSQEKGLFSDAPHVCLEESFWERTSQTATTRYFIIDADSGDVTRHAETLQAYTDEQYRSMLLEQGFEEIRFFPSLVGKEDETQKDLLVIVARKPGTAT